MADLPPIRIFLSPPDVSDVERKLLLDAFDSNWIAPLGPHVDGFEAEMADYLGGDVHCVALSSGTAALHLALLELGVGRGDEVITSTMTFIATANAISYVGANPVFVDVDPDTWQMDAGLVAQVITERVAAGRPPAAVVTVDLYGICADHDPIRAVCDEHDIPVIEDAAEALGASYRGRPAGTLGDMGLFSFNGNKIITTSGGGMLVTKDRETASRVRHLATQARDPAPHYEHSLVGYNYRLSNLLAAVGRGQLEGLDTKVARRRQVHERYAGAFADVDGLDVLRLDPPYGHGTGWLTCMTIDPALGVTTETIRTDLRQAGIEARPTWKPMHLQPLFADTPMYGGRTSEAIFQHGLCLPSGSSLSDSDVDEIVSRVLAAVGTANGEEGVRHG